MPYAHESPMRFTIIPPSAGPTTAAPFHITWLTAAAGAGDPVSAYTWMNRGASWIGLPTCDSISPVHSSRKSREARSGARSTATPRTRPASARLRFGGELLTTGAVGGDDASRDQSRT